ncbi:TonB-dependent receptor [Syntrophotalea acetylenivorans]|uniref:TonB-dependent receptor n=2 Tax=Syntrophotalea acetylenivorans TaxID=1842532 RepID=A0A1L3GT24_9BACT|nr:TonB-dependent receptor [Syntrophotalea acetylenivorans]
MTTPAINNPSTEALLSLSIEELLRLEITSAAKKPQAISNTAAAIFVITQEDIRRCGATSIPEVLRLAPGVNVARIDGNKWAITVRGFNGRFANKLLILMDGRSVYTPLFSGVYWDVQDTLLEDVERIEVIRGPGATLWGANAVNGVINIITRHAEKTHGLLVKGGYGSEERGFGSVRYGGQVGAQGNYRAYVKYFNRDGLDAIGGGEAADDWSAFRGGFRYDGKLSSRDTLTVQGDAYSGFEGQTNEEYSLLPPEFRTVSDTDTDFSGGNLLLRWQRSLSAESNLALQAYYDHTRRDETALLKETRDTLDIDFQHRFPLGRRQEVIWGLGYRVNWDDIDPNEPLIIFNDNDETDHMLSLFIQDEIALKNDLLRLILGTKLEHNDYTGFELQPNARLIWTPNKNHSAWASVSRAVRTPSRVEEDGRMWLYLMPSTPPGVIVAYGNRDYDSEELLAWELGYRVMPTSVFSLDLALFLNIYDNLRSFEALAPDFSTLPEGYVRIPGIIDNKLKAKTWGFEVASDWQVADFWRLQASYSYLQMDVDTGRGSHDTDSIDLMEGTSPKHQLSLRSSLDLPRQVEFDLWLRCADELESLDISGYLTLDLRLGWQPCPGLELALVGQNLLQDSHQEYDPEFQTPASEVPRGIYGHAVWRY